MIPIVFLARSITLSNEIFVPHFSASFPELCVTRPSVSLRTSKKKWISFHFVECHHVIGQLFPIPCSLTPHTLASGSGASYRFKIISKIGRNHSTFNPREERVEQGAENTRFEKGALPPKIIWIIWSWTARWTMPRKEKSLQQLLWICIFVPCPRT